MKSKIVRQLGAMLLAGAMLVTSGNVTTYAAEQTDESVEVDIAQNEALYGAEMDDVEKLEKGDGYFICKELLNGKEKYVAYILIDKTERSIDDILKDVANSHYMPAGNVVAITTVKETAKIEPSLVRKVNAYGWQIKLCPCFYDPMDYYDIYFEQMKNVDRDYSFKVMYNDKKIINELKAKGIIGYSFSINSIDKKILHMKNFLRMGKQGYINA